MERFSIFIVSMPKSQGYTSVRQVVSQIPRFFLADFPMDQQVGRINLLGGQVPASQPDTLPEFVDIAAEASPITNFTEPDSSVAFWAQYIETMVLVELAQNCHRAKFTIYNQENCGFFGDQFVNVSQQNYLVPGTAELLDLSDPGSGDCDRPFAIGQTHDQGLMPKTNFRATHNKMEFTQVVELSFQPHASDRFMPCPDSNSGVPKKPAQLAGCAYQLGRTGDLASNPAYTDRAALISANNQPDHASNLGNPVTRTQFLNPFKPGMKQRVDRHVALSREGFCRENDFTRFFSADQLLFC